MSRKYVIKLCARLSTRPFMTLCTTPHIDSIPSVRSHFFAPKKRRHYDEELSFTIATEAIIFLVAQHQPKKSYDFYAAHLPDDITHRRFAHKHSSTQRTHPHYAQTT